MINLLIYALIVLVLYVIFGSNEHEGEVMREVSSNFAEYRLEMMLGDGYE